VNNLAHRLLVRDAVDEVLLPELYDVRDTLAGMAREHRDLPMLARTHGQPATPTTFGKEMAVYASRLGRATGRIRRATDNLRGNSAVRRAPTRPTSRPIPPSTGRPSRGSSWRAGPRV